MINDTLLNLWREDPFAFAEMHYREQHNMKLNLSGILVPEKPVGEDVLLLCIPQGLTPNKEFGSWTFPKWKLRYNLDALAYKNVRNTTKTYSIWVKNDSEPDQKLLGQSTDQSDSNMEIGMTLIERMSMQSQAYRIGIALDKTSMTFCSGSRTSYYYIPSVGLNSDSNKVRVKWYCASYRHNVYGIRRVWA